MPQMTGSILRYGSSIVRSRTRVPLRQESRISGGPKGYTRAIPTLRRAITSTRAPRSSRGYRCGLGLRQSKFLHTNTTRTPAAQLRMIQAHRSSSDTRVSPTPASYRGGANNEPIPDDSSWNWINGVAWDINLLPTFHWILTDPTSSSNVNKVHYLAISMTLEVVQFGCTSNCKTSVETKSIILTWRPYVTGSNNVQYLDWFARTNPNGHTYTFRPLYSS